ncbi:hypothetical protein L207DRAFT_549887 [Hyaloscypha variabilis F]|uniref:SnoaL-like domain-containing protein n=1 Tax=Hyaloscypha variabilis (strain UAMH 11265 / GT02V1 / F) TaxID=1149755 RepID=A0A2J6QTA9_HYAVF|nr:hypothetical protein L207DRAFT_549887 [Hyaloscypha variabilis F]
MEAEFAELKKQVAALTKESEIRKTHFKYGYYLDKSLFDECVDMFADHPDTYMEFLGARYRGKESIRRLYKLVFGEGFVGKRNGPVHGFLDDHLMMQDIIDVDHTGTHAWCRMRMFTQAGIYENEYIKENGIWKLFRYRFFPYYNASYEKGWSFTPLEHPLFLTTKYPENPVGPDEFVDQRLQWPDTRVVPFHYPHPTTGKRINEDDLRAPHYGEEASTADAALTLSLPADQQRQGAKEGITQTKPGTKVLPEFVQHAT